MQSFNTERAVSSPKGLLKVEGLVWFCVGLYAYYYLEASWSLFFITFLIPDLSLVGYIFGSRIGALCYNFMHTEVWPALLAGFSLIFGMPLLLSLALIWFCHINLDRMLGFGLKYSDAFKHTHLGTISVKL